MYYFWVFLLCMVAEVALLVYQFISLLAHKSEWFCTDGYLPQWNMPCKVAMGIIIGLNWLGGLCSIYFVCVVYEYYAHGLTNVNLVRADAKYMERK